jgi:hypothetical protein
MFRSLHVAVLILVTAGVARAQDDYKPLFNGKDLSGWVNVNCAPNTWFVKDDMIITTGKPTGYLRTDRQYENFILEFEWFHAPNPKGSVGNSGLFVWGDPIPAMGTGYTRSIEVQVLVNLLYKDKKTGLPTATSHGDLFSIWGAKCKPDRPHPQKSERCLPSEDRCKGEYEWNHYKVIGNNGVLKLHVNGKEVSGVTESNPRKGYLALESEGSECRFKNIKIKEMPSTNPKPNEICDVDKGFKCLFTGLDFSGWALGADAKSNWKMSDGVLTSTGMGAAVWTEKQFGDVEIVCDFKGNASLFVRGDANTAIQLDAANKAWSRAVVNVKGDRVTVAINGKMSGDGLKLKNASPGTIGLAHRNEAVQFRNLFVRELK